MLTRLRERLRSCTDLLEGLHTAAADTEHRTNLEQIIERREALLESQSWSGTWPGAGQLLDEQRSRAEPWPGGSSSASLDSEDTLLVRETPDSGLFADLASSGTPDCDRGSISAMGTVPRPRYERNNSLWASTQKLQDRLRCEQKETVRVAYLLRHSQEAVEGLSEENLLMAQELMKLLHGNARGHSKDAVSTVTSSGKERPKLSSSPNGKSRRSKNATAAKDGAQMREIAQRRTAQANRTILKMAEKNLELRERLEEAHELIGSLSTEHSSVLPSKSSLAPALHAEDHAALVGPGTVDRFPMHRSTSAPPLRELQLEGDGAFVRPVVPPLPWGAGMHGASSSRTNVEVCQRTPQHAPRETATPQTLRPESPQQLLRSSARTDTHAETWHPSAFNSVVGVSSEVTVSAQQNTNVEYPSQFGAYAEPAGHPVRAAGGPTGGGASARHFRVGSDGRYTGRGVWPQAAPKRRVAHNPGDAMQQRLDALSAQRQRLHQKSLNAL